jgi:hypothetical protein
MNPEFDEGRHPPDGVEWQERWTFESWHPDATFGAMAAVTLLPASRHAWYWAAVVRESHPLLTLVDTELRILSRSPCAGGWPITCETPLEHWTVANEAFSVALDDPDEALGAQRGVLVPLGFDLEWEAAADPVELSDGYTIDATVSGEILIADENLNVDLTGRWRHQWGPLHWAHAPAHPPHGIRALRTTSRRPPVLVERVGTSTDGMNVSPGTAP